MSAPARRGKPVEPSFRSGDVVYLDRRASPQFVRPITLRVIRTLDWPTYDGWRWLDGYQLNPHGRALARRSLFVRLAGVRVVPPPPVSQSRPRTGALV